MRRPLRITLVVIGLAAAVYGAASLTGGWLGFPPRRVEVLIPPALPKDAGQGVIIRQVVVHDGGELLGVTGIALGLVLLGLGVRPQRPHQIDQA